MIELQKIRRSAAVCGRYIWVSYSALAWPRNKWCLVSIVSKHAGGEEMNIRGGRDIAQVIDKALQVSKKMVDVLGFWAAFHVTFLEDLRNWWISCTNLFLSLFDSCHSVLQEKPRKMIKLSRIIWDAWLNHRDAVCWWGLEGQKALGIKGAIGCWGASRPGETKNREEKISPSEWLLRFWIWQSVHWSNLLSMDLWFILKILKLIFVLHSWAIRIQNRMWLPKLCDAFPVGPSNTFRDCRVQRHYDLPSCFRFHIVILKHCVKYTLLSPTSPPEDRQGIH